MAERIDSLVLGELQLCLLRARRAQRRPVCPNFRLCCNSTYPPLSSFLVDWYALSSPPYLSTPRGDGFPPPRYGHTSFSPLLPTPSQHHPSVGSSALSSSRDSSLLLSPTSPSVHLAHSNALLPPLHCSHYSRGVTLHGGRGSFHRIRESLTTL